MFNLQSAQLFIEQSEDDFFDERNLEIQKAIKRIVDKGGKPSVTTIYNALPDVIKTHGCTLDVKEHFKMLTTLQHYGDPHTILKQFKATHRLCRLKNKVDNLGEIASKGDIEEFDNAFDNMITASAYENEIDDAETFEEIINKPEEQIAGKFFDLSVKSIRGFIPKFRKGQYICIAGAPGEGKTTLAGIFAETIPNMIYQSYEMDADEIRDIIISRNTRIDSKKIVYKDLSFDEARLVESTRRELKERLTLRISTKQYKENDLFTFIKRMKYKHNINGVVIDYAQIIPLSYGSGSKVEKLDELSRRFKSTARDLDIMMIVLSSINSLSLKENRAPILSDVRGSLAFTHDADTVIFLYKDQDKNQCCAIGKQRKGDIGKVHDFVYKKEIHSIY